MSDYAFFLNRARRAAGLVSQIEAAMAQNPDDRALRVNLRSAIRMVERTEHELRDATVKAQVELIRYRLIKHTSEKYGLLGVSRSLELFQEAVSYLYEAVTGRPRIRGGLTAEARKQSELLFGYSYAGSLGVVLLAPGQNGFFEAKFDAVVKTINEVFEIKDNDELRDAARRIGPAAVRKLYEWCEANYAEGYDLDLRWTNSNALEAGRYVESGQFGRLSNLISLTSEVTTDRVAVTGLLVGFDSVLRSFHLVEPDGDAFKGRLDDEFPTLQNWVVNRRYEARFVVQTTTKFSTGEESKKFTLLSLKPVGQV